MTSTGDVVRRSVDISASSVDVYIALDAGTLLQPLERGWPNEVVGVDPVERLRLEPGTEAPWRRIQNWLPDPVEAGTHCGAYGYVGYDVCRQDEEIPEATVRDVELPDVAFDLYDTVAVFHPDGATVEAIEHPRQEAPAAERAAELASRIEEVEPGEDDVDVDASYVGCSFRRGSYLDAVRKVKHEIREGETFQANISQRFTFKSPDDAASLFRSLRQSNPSPYMGVWRDDDVAVISSSPELLLEKDGDKLRTRPIAGTRPRGDGDAEDRENLKQLQVSEKERAEHSILVDLERNDLGKVADYGSVDVEEFMEAVPYAEVHHLESTVKAETENRDISAVDALHALFPGGTVTGAPKPRTLEIIEDVEPTRRGPYTGSMGCFTWDGDCVFNILIRTLVKENQDLHLQVGGGVVHDSSPESEYRETLHKANAVAESLDVSVEEIEERAYTDEEHQGYEAERSTGEDHVDEQPRDEELSGERLHGHRDLYPRGQRSASTGTNGGGYDGGTSIAIVDNYDSFSHNLEQYVGEHTEVEVARYTEPPGHVDGVVFSPGPGRPEHHPVMEECLRELDLPVLGVCLGHQAIVEHYGGRVGYADEVVHGKTSLIHHERSGVFQDLPSPLEVGRYHSLVVEDVPDELEVVAEGADEVMAVRHQEEPVYGVQFHPESILTPIGKKMVENFVDEVREHG